MIIDYSNRKYVIVNVSDVTDDMISASGGTPLEYKRKTEDGSKALFKWDGPTPSCFDGLTTNTHSEIKTELAKSEWIGE